MCSIFGLEPATSDLRHPRTAHHLFRRPPEKPKGVPPPPRSPFYHRTYQTGDASQNRRRPKTKAGSSGSQQCCFRPIVLKDEASGTHDNCDYAYYLAEQTATANNNDPNAAAENDPDNTAENVSFEELSPVPVVPGASKPNPRKKDAELITSLKVRQRKRQKLQVKRKKQEEKEERTHKRNNSAKKDKTVIRKQAKAQKVIEDSSDEYESTELVSDHNSDSINSDDK
ncbi:hypothetical protein FQR65_LT09893 [Abscondita terminalis]|nr:hypothetical protein FQR65_LT09893 [Abscondita terminalis]